MAKTMHVDIVSEERSLYSGDAELLVASADQGDVGIMPGHSQMICLLRPGLVHVHNGDEDEVIYVSGGVLEVQPHTVTVLSDTAERAHDLDEAAAMEAKERAEQALLGQKGDLDYARTAAELAQAAAQLRAIQALRRHIK